MELCVIPQILHNRYSTFNLRICGLSFTDMRFHTIPLTSFGECWEINGVNNPETIQDLEAAIHAVISELRPEIIENGLKT